MFWRNILPPSSGAKSRWQAEFEAVCSFKKSVNFYQTTWHHIPDDSTFHSLGIIHITIGNITVRPMKN
jgi:hypothetical protein